MLGYIVRRLWLATATLFVVTLVIFFILRLLPGDVAMIILSGAGDVRVDPQRYAELRHQLGLDLPLHRQYGNWLWGLLHLDGGTSLYSGQPVFSEVAQALPITLELAVLSTLISLMIALPIGVISAVRQDTVWDYSLRVFGISGLAMPSFFTGSMLILGLVIFFLWLPPLEFAPLFQNPAANLQQMMWPALVLGHDHAAILSRMVRSTMLEVLRQDYIRTALSKGLLDRHVIVRHALRNALLPVVTLLGVQFGRMLGGTVIVESIFVLPGMGSRFVDGVLNRDWVMVQTMVTLFAFAFLLINVLVDLTYALLDPRIRYG